MIAFKDFIPQVQKRVLGLATAFESIHEVLTRANRWIELEHIHVVNIETLLLPNLPGEAEESAPARMTGASSSTSTFQIVRIWYQEQPTTDNAYTGMTRRLMPLDPPHEH